MLETKEKSQKLEDLPFLLSKYCQIKKGNKFFFHFKIPAKSIKEAQLMELCSAQLVNDEETLVTHSSVLINN